MPSQPPNRDVEVERSNVGPAEQDTALIEVWPQVATAVPRGPAEPYTEPKSPMEHVAPSRPSAAARNEDA